MAILTIPKKLAGRDDFVVLPKREYEALLGLRKIKEFVPTVAQKRALAKAEQNLKQNKTFSYNELVRKLGFAS